jgi:hypothetical protein
MQLEPLESAAAAIAWAKARRIERLEPRLTVTAEERQITIPVGHQEVRFSFQEDRGWRPIHANGATHQRSETEEAR